MKFPATVLVELIQMAETPLYSAFSWLRTYLRGNLEFEQFTEILNGLLSEDILQLWETDVASGDRTEIYDVPRTLERRYEAISHDDPTFDPFGYTLTLGPSAEIAPAPPWDADINFNERLFEISARSEDDVAEAIEVLQRHYPDERFIIDARSHEDSQSTVRVSGRVVSDDARRPPP